MQKKLTNGPLLNEQGHLIEAGWHTALVREYDRKAITADKKRIKEWDYYLVEDGENVLCLTLDDNSYMGMISVSLIKRSTAEQNTKSDIIPMTMGKYNFPSTSVKGDIAIENGKNWMRFTNDGTTRVLEGHYEKFEDKTPIDFKVTLTDNPQDTMVIATPWDEDPQAFYYNQKIIGMTAEGTVTCGDKKIVFTPDKAQGLLDWGRGVWTRDNTWYWGAAMGVVDGHRFGWNLGYGFGNTSAASENMLFVDGVCHKLGRITFNIPQTADGKDDFLKPWTVTSDDGRLECDFIPQLNRSSVTDIKIVISNQQQVFGKFTGKCTLDDGTVLSFTDLCGFAEKVRNKW